MAESIPNYAKGYKHFKRALKYAQSVVNKTIDVSLSIRLECSRFITELELEKDKTYPYFYDKVAGEKICCFMETLQHVKGKWTRSEDRFLKLEPWQEFICCNVFGWKKRKDNLRRYLVAYIEVPRKNGKALALDTPIPTPNGFVEMGNLKINDIVYGSNGEQCHITNITDIMYNHKCYEVEFNNGEKIVADANHLWITDSNKHKNKILNTEQIGNSVNDVHQISNKTPTNKTLLTRTIVSVKEVPSVPVRCIEVDSVDHCYLVGPSYIRTHNSFFSAGFGLYMFCVDREAGAEVYCGATNLEQALHVFKPARLICEKNKQLLKKYSIDVKKESMELPDGSIFKPIVGDAHDGASPHCSILDEVHEHPNDALYQSQITGMGGRDQPLVLMITTAGKNIESFCKEQHDYVLKNQQQDILVQDLTTFGVIYSIDDKDDPYTVESIKKANPNFGISVREDYVLRQLDIAKRSIKDRSDYLTKHLNIWVNSKSAYFDSLLWSELAERDLNINDFLKDPCYIAVDLSAKYDLTAIVIMFIRVKNGLKHYYVFTNAYLPSDTIEDSTNINYKIYQKYCQIDNKNSLSGKVLTEIPGAEIDGEFVYNELSILLKKLGNIQMVLYDSWHTTFIMQQLAKAHPSFASRLVELNQNTKNLNAGMKELTSAMLSHRIHHDGSEVLAWNISNVISKTDKKGNDFPDKENKNAKIDTAVCLIMCASQANNFVQKVSLSQRILNGGAIGTINV